MRFSFWPSPTQSFADVLALARHVERTGWDGLWYADHFMPNAPDTRAPWPECWVTLSALGALVPRLTFGALVTGNTYRHPAVLAKMAATLDHITGGRVILGLGAGWQENEHRQYGIPFHTVGERLARLDEACTVIRSLFSEPVSQFAGRFYQLDQATLEPKPLQQPLPLLIGGGGERVTLKLTARHADAWNVWGTPDVLEHKMRILDAHCNELGRDPREIHRTAVALLHLSEDPETLARIRAKPSGRPELVGNVDDLRELVAAYERIGVDELIIPDWTMRDMAEKTRTLDLFITAVAGR